MNRLISKNIFCYLFIFLLLIPNPLVSKNTGNVNEMLQAKLKTAQEIEKSAILNKLAKAYWWDKDKNIALNYGIEALKYAKKFEQMKEKFEANLNIAHAYWRLRNNKLAIKFAKKSIKLSKKISKKDQLDALSVLSSVYEYMKFTKKNLNRFLKIEKLELKISKEINDKKQIVRHTHRIGTIYVSMRRYKKAYENIKRAFIMYKTMGNVKRVIQFLTYFPFFEKKFGDESKIIGYYRQAEELAKLNRYDSMLCRIYSGWGRYYQEKKEFVKSIELFNKGISIAKRNKYYWWSANILARKAEAYFDKIDIIQAKKVAEKTISENKNNNRTNKSEVDMRMNLLLGKIYLIQNRFSLAINKFTEVYSQSSEEAENELRSKSLKNIGELYLKKKEYRRSIIFFKKSLEIAKITKNDILKRDIINLLSEVYLKAGKK